MLHLHANMGILGTLAKGAAGASCFVQSFACADVHQSVIECSGLLLGRTHSFECIVCNHLNVHRNLLLAVVADYAGYPNIGQSHEPVLKKGLWPIIICSQQVVTVGRFHVFLVQIFPPWVGRLGCTHKNTCCVLKTQKHIVLKKHVPKPLVEKNIGVKCFLGALIPK